MEQRGVNGVSLMEHLCELVRRLEEEKKKGSELSRYENVEMLSDLIKKNQLIYKDPRCASLVNGLVKETEEHTSDLTVKMNQIDCLMNDLLRKEEEGVG